MKKALFIIPFIFLSLVAGIWTGLQRTGMQIPFTEATGEHGAFMVCSFLATLIILERAVVTEKKAVLLIPLINGLSVLFFLTGQYKIGYWLVFTGSIGLFGILIYLTLKFKEFYYIIMVLGSISLIAGNFLLIIHSTYVYSIMLWFSFFLLTIVAERLELSKYLPISETKKNILLVFLILILLSGVLPYHSYAKYITALSLVFVAVWLLTYDMALKAVRKKGIFRYNAILLLTGYIWLLVTVFFMIFFDEFTNSYDIMLHSFFLGFVFSMIFAHAPVIFPALMRSSLKLYHPALYLWYGLLHSSLILRITGDLMTNQFLRQRASELNGIAILGFFITIIILARKQSKVL